MRHRANNHMRNHEPDFTRIVNAARNKPAGFLPLYEHAVSWEVQEAILGVDLRGMLSGTGRDKEEAFVRSAGYLASLGYDTYSFEGCIADIVQGGLGLMGRAPAIISSRAELDDYPWAELPDRYFERFDPYFQALERALSRPELSGMKAVGGVGNGPFETAQDFAPLTDLAYLEADDPDTFGLLWTRIGSAMLRIWERFLERYGDNYCVCRIGDDFGFKTSLLMRPGTYRDHILPQYVPVVDLVHRHGKPFLLHSCGAIWEIMDDIIETCRIDAKHSNEDAIAPFSTWLERYGMRIGNFGGIDMDVLCTEDESGIGEYVHDVVRVAREYPGIAIGSGNQIASYVPPGSFLKMVSTVRELRGENLR